MITTLTVIQASFPKKYRNDTILRNELLNAVRNVDAYRLAYHKPADTVQSVISDLLSSIASMEKTCFLCDWLVCRCRFAEHPLCRSPFC